MSFKFRDWQIYKDLRVFRKEVATEIVFRIPKEERFELISQLKRALNSSLLNIAEGAYRASDKDLAHFLNQADTSLNEVAACFDYLVYPAACCGELNNEDSKGGYSFGRPAVSGTKYFKEIL